MPIINKNECKRYRDKIGKLQYIRDFKNNGDIVATSNDAVNGISQFEFFEKKVSKIVEAVRLLEENYKDLSEKVESFSGVLVDETGIVACDSSTGEKVWKEKKGLLGLGKPKWIEEVLD